MAYWINLLVLYRISRIYLPISLCLLFSHLMELVVVHSDEQGGLEGRSPSTKPFMFGRWRGFAAPPPEEAILGACGPNPQLVKQA